jgi:hypothetical protein
MLNSFLHNFMQIPIEGHDIFSGGRQMNCHFASKFVDDNGNWLDLSQ